MPTNNDTNSSFLSVGTVLRGIYRIDSYLASGGFGNTYLATNLEFDEQVAIKEFFMKGVSQRNRDLSISVSNTENVEMFDKLLATFKREAKRLRKLEQSFNTHIVRVHDIFEENNTAYYVMQYIKGRSLSSMLKAQNKSFPEEWIINNILPQLLQALDVIHKNRMWHLDIKPSNIMIDATGNATLIDFGSSKQIDPASGNSTMSSTLSFTRNYAPLEVQQYDYKNIGPWSDIYSLGATLYNLSTNQNPPTAFDIINGGQGAFNFSPNASEEFKNLVMWMMRIKMEDRPHSVAQISEAMNGAGVPSPLTMPAASLSSGQVPAPSPAPAAPAYASSQPSSPESELTRSFAATGNQRERKSRVGAQRGTATVAATAGNGTKKWNMTIAAVVAAVVAMGVIGWAIYSFVGSDSTVPPEQAAQATADSVKTYATTDTVKAEVMDSTKSAPSLAKTQKADSKAKQEKHSTKTAPTKPAQQQAKPAQQQAKPAQQQAKSAQQQAKPAQQQAKSAQQQAKPAQQHKPSGASQYEQMRSNGGNRAL